MMNLTACEWEIVVAAYAYEVLDFPSMSDFTYDLLCSKLGDTNIPNFSADTGLWINELDLDLVKRVYDTAHALYPKFQDIHHHQIVKALNKLEIPFTCCNNNVCFED